LRHWVLSRRVFVLFLLGLFLTGLLFLYIRKPTVTVKVDSIQRAADTESIFQTAPTGVSPTKETEADEATILANRDTVIKAIDLCIAVEENGAPKEKVDFFYNDSREIWLTIQFENAEEQVIFNTVWVYHNPEDPLEFNYAHAAEGNGWVPYYLGIPDNGWPTGNYSVHIFQDDEYILTKRFTIQTR